MTFVMAEESQFTPIIFFQVDSFEIGSPVLQAAHTKSQKISD